MEPLEEKIAFLCEELEIAPPTDRGGTTQLSIDGVVISIHSISFEQAILAGGIAKIAEVARDSGQGKDELLTRSMRLHGARVLKLGLQFHLSIEPDTDELILWTRFDPGALSVSSLLPAVEALLNEIDFRRSWLGLKAAA